jgi:phosphoserine phosphatase RsbU/P
MDPNRVKILLVEDDPDDVWVMRNLLGDRWDGPFDLVHVEVLSAAVERCTRGGIDVVLLDLSLPDSQGLETFIMMHARAAGVPIVVLTGLKDRDTAIKAVQAGAEDYLVKGEMKDDLLIRSIRYAIERTKRNHAEEELRVASEEFRVAQQIQKRLFPASAPRLAGLEIGGAVYPATATAGDYFDFIPMGPDQIGLVVGDVSGHGMGPALVMAETRACLRALAQAHSEPCEILTRANRLLCSEAEEVRFVTVALARVDARQRTLVYASAGQRGYLLDAAGHSLTLDSTSPPLGLDEELIVPAAPVVHLQPGQIIAFFTDGVAEAETRRGERFGVARALESIQRNRDCPAQEIVHELRRAISDFCRQDQQHDDITMVIVKVE